MERIKPKSIKKKERKELQSCFYVNPPMLLINPRSDQLGAKKLIVGMERSSSIGSIVEVLLIWLLCSL